jgi:hypothetical protein
MTAQATMISAKVKPAWLVLNFHRIKACIVFLPVSRPGIEQAECQRPQPRIFGAERHTRV